jgi:hypothetical protein
LPTNIVLEVRCKRKDFLDGLVYDDAVFYIDHSKSLLNSELLLFPDILISIGVNFNTRAVGLGFFPDPSGLNSATSVGLTIA